MDERVAAALGRGQQDRDSVMRSLEAGPKNYVWPAYYTAFDDRAVLAAEVLRLRRLLDARPPYRMSDGWTPAELAALLHRDNEILRAVDTREGDAS